MVPSLPLVLGRPAIPRLCFWLRLPFMFAMMPASVIASIRPLQTRALECGRSGRLRARLGKVVLADVAAGSIAAAADGEQRVHSSIHVSQVQSVGKASLPHWPVERDERRYLVGRTLIGGCGDLRIHRRAGPTDGRLRVALRATLRVEPRSQALRNVVDLLKAGKPRIEESKLITGETGDWRTCAWRSGYACWYPWR